MADVEGDDVRALVGQPDGVAAALPARRAGDHRDLVGEAGHRAILPVARQPSSNGPTSIRAGAVPWTRGAPSTSVVSPVLFGGEPAFVTAGAAPSTLSR